MNTLLGSITIASLSFTGLLPTMPVSDTSPPELGASLRDDTLQSMLSTLPSATLVREDTSVSYYHRDSDVSLTSQSSLGDLVIEQVSDNEALTVTSSDYLQLISVVNDANDLPRYRLSTTDEDIELEYLGDTIEVRANNGYVSTVVGTIEQPWAIDAEGKHVETFYTIDGNDIVQHIDSHAAFPVIADPKVTFGWGVYLTLWGSEANMIVKTASVIAAIGSAVICNGLSKIPHPVTRGVVSALCAVVGGASVIQIINMIAKPERSYINNKCYSGRVVSVSTLKPITKLKPVSASKCR